MTSCLAMSLLDRELNPYHVLRVPLTAEPDMIRAAYRALAWRHHPDRGGSAERMIAINEAWRILGDPARRAAFDAGTLLNPRSPIQSTDDGTSSRIEFGRYAGWTISRLVDHDPEFLQWLARTPAGRRMASEIDAALARRKTGTAAV
jgi:curved DNA-binding protein CbpA